MRTDIRTYINRIADDNASFIIEAGCQSIADYILSTSIWNGQAHEFFDDAELHEGLSQRQIDKIEKFKKSCEGMYMVYGYLCESLWQPDESKEWDFNGYDVYYTKDWVQVYHWTRVQGHRPNAYRVKRENYKGFESLREDDEMWRGQRIY